MAQYEFKHLLNIPFLDGGRDPAVGLDCWGLFIQAAAVFEIDVPDYPVCCFDTATVYQAAQMEIKRKWRPVTGRPEPGDAVSMALDARFPGAPQHFGLMVDGRRFIHTIEKTGSIITPLDHPFFKNKITGFYRYDHCNGCPQYP